MAVSTSKLDDQRNTPPKSMGAQFNRTASCALAKQPDVFTIDVEDWFHIMEVTGTPDLTAWDSLPTHIERNFRTLLELLAAYNVKATCFVLGWVARRFPRLLREAAELGHDIASHGYDHRVVSGLSPAQFREDIRTAKAAIEDAIGGPVHGYRAPGFSITWHTPWAFDEIIEAGYIFDSSVFPAAHGHGGMPEAPRHPYVIRSPAGRLIEFPLSIADTPFGPRCFSGGGYLRLIPLWLVLALAKRVRSNGRGVIWYIHPREIDPGHPRLRMSLQRQFRSYVNLRGTAEKLKAILRDGNFATFSELASRLSEENLDSA
jgi:polysaccharide deacetylase family protein (PEP-CTERM system associated)